MFKEYFKYYKSRKPPPSLKDVMDFEDIPKWYLSFKVKEISGSLGVSDRLNNGLKDPNTWKIYELIDHPGLIFIENPFTALGQRYWTVRCLRDFPFPPNKTNLKEKFDLKVYDQLELKLRWTTLGYHHNWDTKVYSEDDKSEFPEDLAGLSEIIAKKLGYNKFKPEAAIVNYYYFNSTLSGHTDHSEQNLEAPLFSFSFGQSAIFLIGTESFDDKPTPILLRSGDIVIMTKTSHLSYHGVPKILEDKGYPKWGDVDSTEDFDDYNNVLGTCFDGNLWMPYEKFLRNSRINMNVRQVLNDTQQSLSPG
ncbi:nucleic acid dioxygenase ALKBH1 [Coccinella septempunctata]|uniref:nucleic acid dioxygenase ALKBH1 n=1 Tax=Coccinella septempunctata TaxID=41139 RepID=UPI001D0940FA|nr:nucleic acid dioxygenase ALKBH1 [Coccinella septempunctata]